MLNLDSRLLEKLNGDELAVFCHIIKRVNKNNEAFPSRELLKKETGYGREKLAKTINGLVSKKLLKYYQKKSETGKFKRTFYVITTDLASIFVNVKGETLEDLNRDTGNRATGNRNTENPHAEKSTLSINHKLSINQSKSFINEKTESGTIDKITKEEFLKMFSDARTKHLNINIELKRLPANSLFLFEPLSRKYTREDFRHAINGLFCQRNIFKKLKLSPKWLLNEENFTELIAASHGKIQIFDSSK